MNSSFYNGVSGIRTQQFALDTWGHNIANINTVGYKANIPQFETLFSSAMHYGSASVTSDDLGYGATGNSSAISLKQGSLSATDSLLDVAIAGKGWFGVQAMDGGVYYTRRGTFDIDSVGNLVDDGGNFVLDVNKNPIHLSMAMTSPATTRTSLVQHQGTIAQLQRAGESYSDFVTRMNTNYQRVMINPEAGTVNYYEQVTTTIPEGHVKQFYARNGGKIVAEFDNGTSSTVATLGLFYFQNDQGLEKIGDSLFSETSNSGEVFQLSGRQMGTILPSRLEMSNVDATTAMTELIVTQKAYEASARSITTSDQMIQKAINMKAGR